MPPEPAVFWERDVAPRDPEPPYTGRGTCDLAIVGGGYTGLWTAIRARERDPSLDVVLLERGRLGGAASGRNAGFCAATLTHGVRNGAARWWDQMLELERLGHENLLAIAATLRRYGVDAGWELTGSLRVATAPWQLDVLREDAETAFELGWQPAVLGAAGTRRQAASPRFLGGVWDREDTALVHPVRLLHGLAAIARALGVRMYENTTVTALDRDTTPARGPRGDAGRAGDAAAAHGEVADLDRDASRRHGAAAPRGSHGDVRPADDAAACGASGEGAGFERDASPAHGLRGDASSGACGEGVGLGRDARRGRGGAGVVLRVGEGVLRARCVVVATGAVDSLVRGRVTVAVHDRVLVTEPLGAAQRAEVGWVHRQGVADVAHLFHYARLTPDDRVLWGGSEAASKPRTDGRLEAAFRATFPQLEDVAVTHAWSGAVDTSARFTASTTTALGGAVARVAGHTGLGVAASRFAADVALDRLGVAPDAETDARARLDAVREEPVRYPPEPLRTPLLALARRALARADRDGRPGLLLRAMERRGLGFGS
ncbi:NAD(P)/FAD-dependent oxidoreductase [Actinomadura flavalba]|uniref:NAD(P)/FAD-dependent oxidoreductase n=1 Tax=Actinomadura flavalba TaxID=1120938 RepID=UPI00037E40AA|nr:FAD-dependent oxidoreductase [Actinomadura flavalba]